MVGCLGGVPLSSYLLGWIGLNWVEPNTWSLTDEMMLWAFLQSQLWGINSSCFSSLTFLSTLKSFLAALQFP